jgi:hypothetical protein
MACYFKIDGEKHACLRMRSIFFFVALFFGLNTVAAQEWYQGTIVLKSEKILQGELSPQTDHDAVFLRNGDAVMVYPAHKLKSFHFFDSSASVARKFVALEVLLGVASAHQIYELVVEGEINVLRKERSMWYSVYAEALDFDYYILLDDQFIPISKFKRKVYPSLLQNSKNLKKFVHDNTLAARRATDVVKIIEYYNRDRVLSHGVASSR